MVDHRHGFRDITPADLAAEAGYIGLTGLFYSDIGLALINLNWAQALNGGKSKLVICRYDPSEHPMTKSAFFAATAAFVIAAAPVTAGETMTVGWSQLPNAGVRKELEGRSANLEAALRASGIDHELPMWSVWTLETDDIRVVGSYESDYPIQRGSSADEHP